MKEIFDLPRPGIMVSGTSSIVDGALLVPSQINSGFSLVLFPPFVASVFSFE